MDHRHRHEEEERRRMEEELRRHHHQPPPHPTVHHHHQPPSHPTVHHHLPPPPPIVHHHLPPPPPIVHHHQPPPPPAVHHQPPPPSVHHVAHHQQGPLPSFPHHQPPPHQSSPLPESLRNHRTVRIFVKAGEGYSLSVRQGQVVLAHSNHNDPYQHWIKDERYCTKVKDKEGHPSFALVNKGTGEAIKHSIGETHPVRLVHYNPDYLDESVLWTESKDTGNGFRGIRMVNNIKLNFDAFHGDKDHGGVRDGTTVVLWDWWKGDNELWKIVPY